MNRILLGLGVAVVSLAFTSESNAQYGRSCVRPTTVRSYSTPYYGRHSIGPGTHTSRYASPAYSHYHVPRSTIHSTRIYYPRSTYRASPSAFHNPYVSPGRYGGYYPYSGGYGHSGVSLRIGF
ncbi:hypothetical protein N8550_01385 [Pirellulaceae bacterium]|nr:hypothetical protein [Pirellulaceae bacterium]